MIYNRKSVPLSSAHNLNGQAQRYAYDINGNVIFTANAPTITAMTYNVGQWYIGKGDNVPSAKDAEYYDLHNGMIQRANADILCINEYWDNMTKLPRTALSMLEQYYPYHFTSNGSSGYFGRAIYSKYPLTNITKHSYSNDSARYYDSATITVDDIPITIVVTHLNYNDKVSDVPKRYPQLEELMNYLSTLDHFICCGDLNTLYAKTTEEEDYIEMVLPLLNAGFNLANCSDHGFMYTYASVPDGAWYGCLDHIITSSNISVLSAHVDETKLTDSINDLVDHMPLIAELQIN